VQLSKFLFIQRAEDFLGHIRAFVANAVQHIFTFLGQVNIDSSFISFVGLAADPAGPFELAQKLAQ